MNGTGAHHAMVVPLAARAAGSPGLLWRALVATARRLRGETHPPDRDALEREGLAGLSEHLLKDIGASPWLAADAATRALDDLRARVDGGLG